MKKNLKTKIAAGIAALSLAASPAVMAADISPLYEKMFNGSDAVDIMYNGQIVKYTDVQPQIMNDRVMLPFRAVLENMGASVDYNESAKMVTAVRGDTTIRFSLNSNIIDVDKNGEKSQITMDVPIEVVNDRTVVPVRFISNALDMKVSWDEDLRTVVIIDGTKYIDEISALPNFGKLMNIETPAKGTSNGTMTIKADGKSEDVAFDGQIDLKYDSKVADGVSDGSIKLDLDIDGLNAMLEATSGEKSNIKNVNDAVIDYVVSDEGVIYFKTNLIEKIAEVYPENQSLKKAAALGDSSTWFKFDLFGIMGQSMPFKTMLGANDAKSSMDAVIKTLTADEESMDVMSAYSTDMAFAALKAMDKYITVNVEENGNYTISINMDKNAFKQMLIDMSGEDADEVFDSIDFNLKADSSFKDGKTAETMTYVIGADIEGTSFKVQINMETSGDTTADVQAAKVPAAAVDIMNVINAL